MNEKIPSDLPIEPRRDFLKKVPFVGKFFEVAVATLPFAYTIDLVSATPRESLTVTEGKNLREEKGLVIYDLGEPVEFKGRVFTPFYGKGGSLKVLPVDRIAEDQDREAVGIIENLEFYGFTVDADFEDDDDKDNPAGFANVVAMPFVINRADNSILPLKLDSDGLGYIIHDGKKFRVLGYLGVLKKKTNIKK